MNAPNTLSISQPIQPDEDEPITTSPLETEDPPTVVLDTHEPDDDSEETDDDAPAEPLDE